jgi:hypothetical protein
VEHPTVSLENRDYRSSVLGIHSDVYFFGGDTSNYMAGGHDGLEGARLIERLGNYEPSSVRHEGLSLGIPDENDGFCYVVRNAHEKFPRRPKSDGA